MTWYTRQQERGRITAAIVAAASLALAGCSGSEEAKPTGIERAQDALKRSPCACLAHPQQPLPPGYVEEFERWRSSRHHVANQPTVA